MHNAIQINSIIVNLLLYISRTRK